MRWMVGFPSRVRSDATRQSRVSTYLTLSRNPSMSIFSCRRPAHPELRSHCFFALHRLYHAANVALLWHVRRSPMFASPPKRTRRWTRVDLRSAANSMSPKEKSTRARQDPTPEVHLLRTLRRKIQVSRIRESRPKRLGLQIVLRHLHQPISLGRKPRLTARLSVASA